MLSSNSLREILDKHGANWVERRTDAGEPHSWIKIVEYESNADTSHSYGLLKTGEWVAEFADHQRIMPVGHFVPFYPLLELTHRDAVRLIEQDVVNSGLPSIVHTTFPFDDILESAFLHTGHWSSLGQSWIESGYPISDVFADLLPGNSTVRQWKRERYNQIYFIDNTNPDRGITNG